MKNLQPLDWDSRFWGFPVAHLELPDVAVLSLDLSDLNKYTVVQSLIELNQPSDSRFLVKEGFFPVDTRIEYKLKIGGPRAYNNEQNAVCIDIAEDEINEFDAALFASVLTDSSRFNSFPTTAARVTQFYTTWILNARSGVFDDGLVTATIEKTPVALISYRSTGDALSIGLIAVHPSYQGRGLARRLIHHIYGMAQRRKQPVITVVTEGCNIPAQRFYESTGFLISTAGLWMYRVHE